MSQGQQLPLALLWLPLGLDLEPSLASTRLHSHALVVDQVGVLVDKCMKVVEASVGPSPCRPDRLIEAVRCRILERPVDGDLEPSLPD